LQLDQALGARAAAREDELPCDAARRRRRRAAERRARKGLAGRLERGAAEPPAVHWNRLEPDVLEPDRAHRVGEQRADLVVLRRPCDAKAERTRADRAHLLDQ
jgi:hypothetical protein